jgi:prepilin-type N-terminal cleavage/methylation domain-containing protein
MKPVYSTYKPGFTIVELLIVVVVIAILASISILSYNGITQRARQSALNADISAWKRTSEAYKVANNIECPPNYVFVYGNANIAGSTDFCVMKYEAKIQGNDNGQTTYTASMSAESRATGTPWVNITPTNAALKATESGGHLLTETEWMTLAADVLSVKYNWSGSAVGSGFIYSGHNDNIPANALAASTDDTDGYYGTGNSDSNGPTQKRTLYLRSGDVIWDVAGNAWEATNATIAGGVQPGYAGDSGYVWRQWTDSAINWGGLPSTSRPSALNGIPGLSAASTWSSNNGIGQLYSNRTETGIRNFRRGGYFNSTGSTGAGVLALALSDAPTSLNTNLSFRVAR